MSRKLLAWSAIPVCLFLITMGIRLPNLATLHATPKPRPRAVLETISKNTSKPSPHVTTSSLQLAELCDNLPAFAPRSLFRSRLFVETRQFDFISSIRCSARSPPFPC